VTSAAVARMKANEGEGIRRTLSCPGASGAPEQLSWSVEGEDEAMTPEEPTAAEPPALLPDLLAEIARLALEAGGRTLKALSRLSSVCVAWREYMQGENLPQRSPPVVATPTRPSMWVRCVPRPSHSADQFTSRLAGLSEADEQRLASDIVVATYGGPLSRNNRQTVVILLGAGLPVVLHFAEVTRSEQRSWLQSSLQPVRTGVQKHHLRITDNRARQPSHSATTYLQCRPWPVAAVICGQRHVRPAVPDSWPTGQVRELEFHPSDSSSYSLLTDPTMLHASEVRFLAVSASYRISCSGCPQRFQACKAGEVISAKYQQPDSLR